MASTQKYVHGYVRVSALHCTWSITRWTNKFYSIALGTLKAESIEITSWRRTQRSLWQDRNRFDDDINLGRGWRFYRASGLELRQSWTQLPRCRTRGKASWADGKRTRGGAKVTQNARQRTTDAKNCVRADDIAIAWRVGEWKSAFCAVLNGPSYWNARWLTREKCFTGF